MLLRVVERLVCGEKPAPTCEGGTLCHNQLWWRRPPTPEHHKMWDELQHGSYVGVNAARGANDQVRGRSRNLAHEAPHCAPPPSHVSSGHQTVHVPACPAIHAAGPVRVCTLGNRPCGSEEEQHCVFPVDDRWTTGGRPHRSPQGMRALRPSNALPGVAVARRIHRAAPGGAQAARDERTARWASSRSTATSSLESESVRRRERMIER